MLDRGKVVLGDIFLYHKAVHGWRRAEGGNMVFSKKRQQIMGVKAVKIINKNSRLAEPLAIELAPHGFGPASIRDSQVQSLWVHAVPILGSNKVP